MITVDQAINLLRQGRQTHVDWIDHYDGHDCRDCTPEVVKAVGDREHHEKSVESYDQILELLEYVGGSGRVSSGEGT